MHGFDFCTGMRPGEVAARRWRDLDTTMTPLSSKGFRADLERLGLRGGRSHYETRATFRSLAIAGGAPREELDLITHPSPK
jgi:integrase